MKKFDPKKTKYILNIKAGTYHYYNTDKCVHSKKFNPNDPNLKFYETEAEVIRDYQYFVKKCRTCFFSR